VSFHAPAIKATELLETPQPPQPEPCRPGVPWMLWWIVGVHACWGVGLIMRPQVLETLVVLIGVDWITNAGVGPTILGGLLIAVSIAAAVGLVIERRLENAGSRNGIWFIACLLCPQYFIVLAAFISDITTLTGGTYHGQDVQRWVLLCALAPVVWGALLHTASILERYALVWRRR
jgi:hypothetical protein